MGTISAIMAVIKAVPIIDAWFKQLAAAYLQYRIAAHDKEFVEATRSLIVDHDQRALEEAASGRPSAPAQDQTGIITRPGRN